MQFDTSEIYTAEGRKKLRERLQTRQAELQAELKVVASLLTAAWAMEPQQYRDGRD